MVKNCNLKQKAVGLYQKASLKLWFAYMTVTGLFSTAAAEESTEKASATAETIDTKLGIFENAKTVFNSLYKDIAGLSTVAAGVCIAVCLFLMFFSKSPKTVEESTSWFKRILICWIGIMLLSSIFAYLSGGLNISENVSLL